MSIGNISDPSSLAGAPVHGGGGVHLGKVDAVYYDNGTHEAEWVAVKTGLFGGQVSIVPLERAEWDGSALAVPFSQEQLTSAPHHDPDQDLSVADEKDLYRHYGIDYSRSEANPRAGRAQGGEGGHDRTGEPGIEGRDVSGPTTDEAMTRSEERLNVGLQTQEAGRARLRKHVVSEHQQVSVPVSREEVTIEREPITEANRGDALDGPAISEEEHEIVLHEERPVVETEAVPVERVHLGKTTRTEQETVGGEVRKEQIDTEGDVDLGYGRREP
jgi:uncharacterized protein (TIGR02271 family)